MHVTAVESSALARVAYDEAAELLQVEFCSQLVYRYFGVPLAVYQALLEAASKGAYFNQAIRERFPYCLVSGFDDAPDAEGPAGHGS
jgi:hypothetical protein